MLNLFVELFGGSQAMATTVFLSLETQSAKTAAIQAAAQKKLGTEQEKLDLLRAILAIAKTNQKSRDKLAHWTWGDSLQLPDALLLIDPKNLPVVTELDYSDIYVYRDHDFREIISANDRLCGFGLNFRWVLSDHPANQNNALFAQLCAEPEIREKLSRLA